MTFSLIDAMRTYNLIWERQSAHSGESMPVGGHSIGCNVWVENDDLLLYFAQSGAFDENGSMLKGGRLRVRSTPTPFALKFRQTLELYDGYIHIEGESEQGTVQIRVWVEVGRPVIHVDWTASFAADLTVTYESWRTEDRRVDSQSYELFQCKEVWGDPTTPIVFHKDQIEVTRADELLFYHRNRNDDLSFDREMDTQGMQSIKAGLHNPQRNRTMGGLLTAPGLEYTGTQRGRYVDTDFVGYQFQSPQPTSAQRLQITLYTAQTDTLEAWISALRTLDHEATEDDHAREAALAWWQAYWARSYIVINGATPDKQDVMWQIGRNYQLFRYLLGCNYYGEYPTKFNGGLFTFDPIFAGKSPWSEQKLHYTPDYRLWGGGSHTSQNQRLVYWPMLKSGDFDMLPQIFNFFNRLLETATLRAQFYFDVDGAVYPEQIGIYGLCPTCDHGWGNTTGLPVPQIKYHFSTALEIGVMLIEYAAYTHKDIGEYIGFLDGIVKFYDGFYPQNDARGKMIIEPGNALETYHPVRNPIDAVSGLHALLGRMLALPERYSLPEQRANWRRILERVPPITTRTKAGQTIIAYAESTSERHNVEIPELYPVFPFGQYGIGQPDLQLAIDTARLAAEGDEQLSHISWHQQGIQYAKLGMLSEASDFLIRKLGNADQRVPVYWGPGHDWTPDHNWGGSGMIQLQEMLLQTNGDTVYLLPCWDKRIDVVFRLHAPGNTIIECEHIDGQLRRLTIISDLQRLQVEVRPTPESAGAESGD